MQTSNESAEAAKTTSAAYKPPFYTAIISAIAHTMGSDWFPTADRAALKRYEPGLRNTGQTVCLKLLLDAGFDITTLYPQSAQNWTWLLHCMAIMSGADRNPSDASLEAKPGRVLYRVGYTEEHLGLLLAARDDDLLDLIRRAARRMAAKSERVNWPRLAPLLLAADRQSAWAEKARLAIARDYFIAQAQARTEAQTETVT